MQHAIIKYTQGDFATARDLFKQAYELDTRNDDALKFYTAMMVALGDMDEVREVLKDERIFNLFAADDFFASTVNTAGDMELLAELYEARVILNPTVPQGWASLSFIYYQAGEKDKAIDALRRSLVAAPVFAKTAQCFIDNIEADKNPQEGC
jgi:tetratricopeptide (TPR) repeat protein